MSLIRRTQIESIIGEISSNNSTTTPLAASATFLGESDQIPDYKAIGVYLHTDTSGQVSFEFSSDGTNWDHIETLDIPANTTGEDAKFYQLAIVAEWFRVRFTNGSTPQTEFRLQTILHPVATISDQQKISDEISGQSLVTLNKSVIAGQSRDADFHTVGTSEQGRLKVSLLEVQDGDEYTYTSFSEWAIDEVKKFMLSPPPSSSDTLLSLAFETNGEGQYEIRYFEDCITSSDGFNVDLIPTEPGIRNRNRNLSDTANREFDVFASPTVTTSGALISVHRPPEGGLATSAVANKPNSFILANGKKYLVRMKNTSGSPNLITWVADFTQIPEIDNL